MTSIVIITASFPCEGGEQFIEEEIKYWVNSKFENIYILPMSPNSNLRSYPKKIQLLLNSNEKSNFVYAFKAIFTKYFFIELLFILKNRGIKIFIKNSFLALKAIAQMLKVKDKVLYNISALKEEKIVVYSYWNDVSAYASCILKDQRYIYKVFSRAHGSDLYEERRLNSYMPLKRQFIDSIDKVYVLSEAAEKYYKDRYGKNIKNIGVYPLGVKIPDIYKTFLPSVTNIEILSLSFCVPVKQIDQIMIALSNYAKENETLKITWNHIGDGPLKNYLEEIAAKVMSNQKNITINFFGKMSNTDVHMHLSISNYDVFINGSSSEGIPVSIMEAMSYEIPAIAPNIGGISDLINDCNGYLLPEKYTIQDVSNGINKIRSLDNALNLRKNSRQWIISNFNANEIYPSFIMELEELSLLYE